MRQFLAVSVLIIFATLASTDGFACPDGCQAARSAAAADHCNATGGCVFCTAAFVIFAANPVMAPRLASVPAPEPEFRVPQRPSASLDHPPRLA